MIKSLIDKSDFQNLQFLGKESPMLKLWGEFTYLWGIGNLSLWRIKPLRTLIYQSL